MPNNRSRTASGSYRMTRSDTQVKTIEKKYGVELNARSNMKIGNYLKREGYPSLSKLLKDSR